MTSRVYAIEAMQLAESIKPLLAGKGPDQQSAALAELVSLWLAGMFVSGDEVATGVVRAQALAAFVNTVTQLIPINEAEITKPMLEERLKRG